MFQYGVSSGHRTVLSMLIFALQAYAAAKGGVAQLTKSLSNQWASSGINVNAVCHRFPSYRHIDMLIWRTDSAWIYPYRHERGTHKR